MLPSHVIFDFDGTLIDSAAAILASYRAAFAECGVAPVCDIEAGIIGPPIHETLRLLTDSEDATLIARLIEAFRRNYDTGGLLQTKAYPGVGDMLRALHAAGMRLSIATNKRIYPTRLILEHLGWDNLWDSVYALDLFTPHLPHKAAMLGRLIVEQKVDVRRAVYVGDRMDDFDAAQANSLPFIAAAWGYGFAGSGEASAYGREASSPLRLQQILLNKK
ncbi:MAG: HAD hydrolase-like protein [Azoarcus sp.]|jgi:phosphoglycolate phosphatase|nr:HAD hydrolase-like protein [Azoarcus sp.]